MPQERVISSYLLRFSEKRNYQIITLQNLKTGEQLEFETWVAAWAFLEGCLTSDASLPRAPPCPLDPGA